MIDDLQINGDFVESQAFAFLAVRSFKKLANFFSKPLIVKIHAKGVNY